MKKLNIIFVLSIIVCLLNGCAIKDHNSNVDHSVKEIVQMKVENKTIDDTYITKANNHYNIEVSYNGSKYILKDRIIFNNVKESDSIDVLYVTEYDSENRIVNAYIQPITQK